ncbi:hypothetical protein [Algoriphagus terrigena]|uniref:hypothetical protein n=1 Tax=Algoriphagus terrigena TaxID=344884 RepID=UPI0004034DBA|nr:hypothetical protein [Algoriphagus terrigena]
MPANKKYLSSPLQRIAKITAGLIGGYAVTVSFFLMLSLWLDRQSTFFALIFAGFLLWCGLLILAFLAKNGWKIWLVYLGIASLFSLVFYLNPA